MGLTLFRNARIFTPADPGGPAAGRRQAEVASYPRGALLCRDGRIVTAGDERAVLEALGDDGRRALEAETDCRGLCMIPGFVDAHTHICFMRPRETEFRDRLEGADYLDILSKGGGILSSVAAVRAASEEELFTATRDRALSALSLGTTTIEIKSGYGLALDAELKQLAVIGRLRQDTPLSVVPTFMAAHAVPPEFEGRADDYVDAVIGMLPAACRAGALFCDVFCEQGVFTAGQTRRILEAAAAAGMGLKLHADELHDTGGALLAAQLRAISADHLLAASNEGLLALAAAGSVAVLLPVTAFSMRRPFARAREMIAMGLPVAIATDCNPGSSCVESMPFAVGLSVMMMGLSVNEALVASTLNAAYAVGAGHDAGSLTPGKAADFLLLEGESPAVLAFRTGISPVAEVYKGGALAAGPAIEDSEKE
jgi:imidazolonepropionase